jgi:hypothetical protein
VNDSTKRCGDGDPRDLGVELPGEYNVKAHEDEKVHPNRDHPEANPPATAPIRRPNIRTLRKETKERLFRDVVTLIPDRVAEEWFGPTRDAHRPRLSEDLIRDVGKMKTEWQPWARLTLTLIQPHVERVKDLKERFEILRKEIEQMQASGARLPPIPRTDQHPVIWGNGRHGALGVEWVVVRTLQELAWFEASGITLPNGYSMTAYLWDRVVRRWFRLLGLPQAERPLRKMLAKYQSKSRRAALGPSMASNRGS